MGERPKMKCSPFSFRSSERKDIATSIRGRTPAVAAEELNECDAGVVIAADKL